MRTTQRRLVLALLVAVVVTVTIHLAAARGRGRDSLFTLPRFAVVGLGGSVGATFRNEAEVRQALEKVLASPEYRRLLGRKQEEGPEQKENWLTKLLRDFFEWLFGDSLDGEGAPGGAWDILRPLTMVLALLALALVIVLIARSVLERAAVEKGETATAARERGPAPQIPPGELPSQHYLDRALELAQGGDFRQGLRELLLGAMSWIERAGLIRYRKGLTNRDYLRAVWRRPASRDSLAVIVRDFEQVYFGRRPATVDRFDNCLAQYRDAFQSDERETPE